MGKKKRSDLKKKAGHYGWATKRKYNRATGRYDLIRFRVKPKIQWGTDPNFPKGRGMRITAKHPRDLFHSGEAERLVVRNQNITEKVYGLRKGFGLFRNLRSGTYLKKIKLDDGTEVNIKTPLELTGITGIPRQRQRFPDPMAGIKAKRRALKFKTGKLKSGERVRGLQMSRRDREKQKQRYKEKMRAGIFW